MEKRKGSRRHNVLKEGEARKGLIEKVTTEQSLEESEGSDVDIWKNSIQGRRNSKCQEPEVGP